MLVLVVKWDGGVDRILPAQPAFELVDAAVLGRVRVHGGAI